MAVGGIAAAAAGFIVLLIVYGVAGRGGADTDFKPQIAETLSESDAEAFDGGARLHFPVESIDFGHVPLNTEVGYAFAMTNLGDAEAEVGDVRVKMLEGC